MAVKRTLYSVTAPGSPTHSLIEAAAETHGQHAVGDGGVQTDLLGDFVVPVNRVEVAGDAGVVHQVSPGQVDQPFRKFVADFDRT